MNKFLLGGAVAAMVVAGAAVAQTKPAVQTQPGPGCGRARPEGAGSSLVGRWVGRWLRLRCW